jgi:hypothetical protein
MDLPTHYVIVVHGTFAAPQENERQWYQLDESDPNNFCNLLNGRFESAGFSRPIERAFNGETIHFCWSGDNDHFARIHAAEDLYHLMTRLMAQDRSARVHLIAHSHGGNVVLQALELYMTDIVNAACGWYWGVEVRMDEERRSQIDEVMEEYATRGMGWREALTVLLADEGINQIGKVVFLGTPFYGKSWRVRGWNTWRVMQQLVLNAMQAVVLLYAVLVVLYGGSLLFRGIDFLKQQLIRNNPPPVPAPNLNFLSWTPHSILYFSMAVLIIAVLAVRGRMKRLPRNIPNVYFDETTFNELLMDSSQQQRITPPFKALVISMGLLDEALLGLSAEPIVYGLLAPRIRAMFEPRQSISREPMGNDSDDLSAVMTGALQWMGRESWQKTAALRRWISWATSPLHRPAFQLLINTAESFLLRVIASAAFGVPPQEFSDSTIVVKKEIAVPQFFSEVHMDVSPSFQAEEPNAPQTSHVAEPADVNRYAFLANDDLLEKLAARSSLCGELEKSERHLVARYRDYPEGGAGLLTRLRRISLTLEHRLGDLATGLGHGRYYSMPHVIDAIANFIVSENVADNSNTAGHG